MKDWIIPICFALGIGLVFGVLFNFIPFLKESLSPTLRSGLTGVVAGVTAVIIRQKQSR